MNSSLRLLRAASVCIGAAAMLASAWTDDALRDPIQVPAQLRSTTPDAGPTDEPAQARHILVIGGQSYLIVGGRRLGVGDKIGDDRIERFSDGAVWIRQAGKLRSLSLYAGVEKRPAAVPRATAASQASPKTKKPAMSQQMNQPQMAPQSNQKEKP